MYRSIGEWNAALYELERASEIEPENVELLEEQALTHLLRRDYLIAESFMDKALEQVPEYEPAQIQKVNDSFAPRWGFEFACCGRPEFFGFWTTMDEAGSQHSFREITRQHGRLWMKR